MEKLQPHYKRKREPFITWDKYGYLLFNASLARLINKKYDNPPAVSIYVDEEKRLIRIQLCKVGGEYALSYNGTGAGLKTTLRQGNDIQGLEHRRYYDLEYGTDYIDMRY